MSHTLAGRSIALAVWLAVSAPPALALGLGEAQLRSALGEPLDLVVALAAAPGEPLAPECFHVSRPAPGGPPVVTRAQFSLESGPRLRVRTPQPLNEPVMLLSLNASCPGGGLVSRDYPLLLDPRPVVAALEPAAAMPTEPASAAPPSKTAESVGQLRALPGDTLRGIATAIYPKNRRAREAYLVALREANPALAGLGPDEPIAPDTPVVLPELKSFSQRFSTRATAPTAPAPENPKPSAAPAPAVKKAVPPPAPTLGESGTARVAPAPATGPGERKPAAKPRTPQQAPAPRAGSPPRATGGFVLRLSAPEVDLARSRGIDDRTRAQLRERLLLLDADDQVSAMLQMRNSLRQLENRVSELQLRLSGPPATQTGAAPTKAPSAATPAPPIAAPPSTTAAPAPPTAAPAPSAPAAPTPAAPAPKAVESTPLQAPVAAGKPTTPPRQPEPAPAAAFAWPLEALGLAALAVGGLAFIAYRVTRRRSRPAAKPVQAVPARVGPTPDLHVAAAMPDLDLSEPEPRVEAESDAALTTRIPGADPQSLRRRYLEERFPEIANGTLDIANPDAVVKGARLFYEDGSLPRAVELLQFAIEENPAAMKPWLALFEIFRLERLVGEFGTLAARFRERHGASDNWRKVQYIGREIDPQNALYRDDAFGNLETIGYPDAARARAITFDPLAENWLNAPMDFTSDALAAELRRALLAQAGLAEQDVVPNPMPALKQVEMFTVA